MQVGFEKQWLDVLAKYVVPIQIKVFPGYYSRVNHDSGDGMSLVLLFLGKSRFEFRCKVSSTRPA